MKKWMVTLENGERRILTEKHLNQGTFLFYTEIGLEFGTIAVVDIAEIESGTDTSQTFKVKNVVNKTLPAKADFV